MTHDYGSPGTAQINVFPAVHIIDITPLAAHDDGWVSSDLLKGAERAVDATRDELAQLSENFL